MFETVILFIGGVCLVLAGAIAGWQARGADNKMQAKVDEVYPNPEQVIVKQREQLADQRKEIDELERHNLLLTQRMGDRRRDIEKLKQRIDMLQRLLAERQGSPRPMGMPGGDKVG